MTSTFQIKRAAASIPLDQHLHAVKTANHDLLRRAFTDQAHFLGTDDGELWTIDQLVELLCSTKGQGWEMVLKNREVFFITANVLNFIEFLEHDAHGAMRGSGALLLIAGEWKIQSYTLSSSMPNRVVTATDFVECLSA